MLEFVCRNTREQYEGCEKETMKMKKVGNGENLKQIIS